MAAEVATSPSQASTSGGNVGSAVSSVVGVAGHSSGPKSTFRFNSPTSSSIARCSPPQKYQSQSTSQCKPTSSPPNDDASSSPSSFFSHHQQRLSPSSLGSTLSSAQGSSIPRGLPPLMTGTPPAAGGGAGTGAAAAAAAAGGGGRGTAAGASGGAGGGSGNGGGDGGGAGTGAMDPRLPMSPGPSAMRPNDNQDALCGDPTAPRKRSKVSRACDECRRKKVGSAWIPSLVHSCCGSYCCCRPRSIVCGPASAQQLSGSLPLSLCVYQLLSG